MMKITVIKRDGSTEAYDRHKMVRVVQAAGLNSSQAEELAEAVDSWIHNENLITLTSLQIRDKVLEELKRIHKPSADLYAWYQQTKEKV